MIDDRFVRVRSKRNGSVSEEAVRSWEVLEG